MRIIIFLILYLILHPTFCMVNVFYILHEDRQNALAQVEKNIPLAQMLIAQAYVIDKKGVVSGTIDSDVLDFAAAYKIPLLAMVTNSKFDPVLVHQFLQDTSAQKNALNTLIAECQKNHLAGLQFDFEMVRLEDKNNLTTFYQNAATKLHQNGLIVSFAIAPVLMDSNFPTAYLKKLYEVWQGAYDFQKLGEASDFVTIMTYDQHADNTTPGAIAGIPWDIDVIQHALQFIPANKISLGIPTYSGLWYIAMNSKTHKITVHYDTLSDQKVNYILSKYHIDLAWDRTNKVHYVFYDSHGINKYIFVEDATSFKYKRALAMQYQLYGISIFRLGIEDPEIWDIMQDKPWWKFW